MDNNWKESEGSDVDTGGMTGGNDEDIRMKLYTGALEVTIAGRKGRRGSRRATLRIMIERNKG